MNVLLLFAFTVCLFSVIKDFIDNQWIWGNKILFSLILLVFSLIPLVINLITFLSSDLCIKKVIRHNFLKFILMDHFERFMYKLICKGGGIFCNQSSTNYTEHNGGRVKFLSATNPPDIQSQIEASIASRFDMWGSVSDVSSMFKVNMKTNKIGAHFGSNRFKFIYNGDNFLRSIYSILLSKEFHTVKWCSVREVFLEDVGSKVKAYANGRQELTVDMSKDDSVLFTHNGSAKTHDLSCFGKVFSVEVDVLLDFSSYNEYMIKRLNRDSDNKTFSFMLRQNFFKIGLMNLLIDSDRVYFMDRETVLHSLPIGLGHDIYKNLEFLNCLKFWAENPEKGVYEDLNPKMRKGAFVYHCLSVQDILSKLRSGYVASKVVDIGYKRCLVEDLQDELFCRLIGKINMEILDEITCYFGIEEVYRKEIYNKIFRLINARSLACQSEYNVSKYKFRRYLVCVNYFLKLIKFGNLNYLDKSLTVPGGISQICRRHEMVNTNLPNKSLADALKEESDGKKMAKKNVKRLMKQCKIKVEEDKQKIKSFQHDSIIELMNETVNKPKTYKDALYANLILSKIENKKLSSNNFVYSKKFIEKATARKSYSSILKKGISEEEAVDSIMSAKVKKNDLNLAKEVGFNYFIKPKQKYIQKAIYTKPEDYKNSILFIPKGYYDCLSRAIHETSLKDSSQITDFNECVPLIDGYLKIKNKREKQKVESKEKALEEIIKRRIKEEQLEKEREELLNKKKKEKEAAQNDDENMIKALREKGYKDPDAFLGFIKNVKKSAKSNMTASQFSKDLEMMKAELSTDLKFRRKSPDVKFLRGLLKIVNKVDKQTLSELDIFSALLKI